ncbi:hypothetical protein MRB53_002062 [Persea americana]|uniref:Uncharacterized protein n=1 Tax=Persea americana TaxID=3435 RepID=A0ACC2MTP0_PERAE|nr:hypothetical protein MRB53_002062 [Persea americana]
MLNEIILQQPFCRCSDVYLHDKAPHTTEPAAEHMNINGPNVLELPPCDPYNVAEPAVSQQQLSLLDDPTSHHETSSVIEPQLLAADSDGSLRTLNQNPWRILFDRSTDFCKLAVEKARVISSIKDGR